MTGTELENAVKYYIGDTSASVDEAIKSTLRDLSRYVFINKLSTVTSTSNQNIINFPSNAKRIQKLSINNKNIDVVDYDYIEINNNQLRYYTIDSKIYLTQPLQAGEEIKIYYTQYIEYVSGINLLNVPTDSEELIILGSAMRYMLRMFNLVAITREKYPDIQPEEVLNAYKQLRKDYTNELENYTKSMKYRTVIPNIKNKN